MMKNRNLVAALRRDVHFVWNAMIAVVFIGFASLPLHDVEASLAEIDRATGELGMKGVAIGSNIGGPPLNDARFEPLWAKLDAMRMPVFEPWLEVGGVAYSKMPVWVPFEELF